MRIKIKLLKPFSDAVGKSEFDLEFIGKNLVGLIKELTNKYPDLKGEFYKESEELTEYICIFVNDKPISALNGIDTELKNNDEILFFVPISGG
jgi:MoaD family protein